MTTKLQRITISLTPEMYDTIAKIAKRKNSSLSNSLVGLAKKALEVHTTGNNPDQQEIEWLANIHAIQLRGERKLNVLAQMLLQYVRVWFARNPEPTDKSYIPQAKRREWQYTNAISQDMESAQDIFAHITHRIENDITLLLKSIEDNLKELTELIPNEEGKELVEKIQRKVQELIPLMGY